MSNEITSSDLMEQVLIKGDLSKLTPHERNQYYMQTCKSIGLNPLTKPFDYITLNGRMVMYAKRDAADQLRKLNGVSIEITDKQIDGDMFFVTARATDRHGRQDEDLGAVALPKGAGEIRANAMLKAITKAKRRVTLSICGLGFLDETEVEDIPDDAKLRPSRSKPIRTIKPPDQALQEQADSPPRPLTADATAHEAADPASSSGDSAGGEATTDQLAYWDHELGQAARAGGMITLQNAWSNVPPQYKTALKAALDRRHKPTALEADKAREGTGNAEI